MNFEFMSEYYMFFLNGVKVTISLSFFAVILGTFLGIFLALFKLSKNPILKAISSCYIEFLRGTPILVQLYIIYYGLPSLGIELPDFLAAIIALSLNSGAYVAEIIRAGIESIDKGQMEASRSLGFNYIQSMKSIVIPQALRNILPALGNEFITIIKESAIVSVISIKDLMYNSDTVRSNTFQPFEPLIISAIIYFILTFTLSKLMSHFERRLKARA